MLGTLHMLNFAVIEFSLGNMIMIPVSQGVALPHCTASDENGVQLIVGGNPCWSSSEV